MMIRNAAPAGALLCLLAVATTPIRAQCELAWLPGAGHNGTSGNPYNEHIYALHRWDPDGPGPAPMRLVFGGAFPTIGSIAAEHVAGWDPATKEWTQFGSGTLGKVYALATAANGDLLAAGSFPGAGGGVARSIARWNGSSWSALGEGISGRINDIAVLPNGDIVVVGAFTNTGASVPVNRVARWDGSSWSALGSGSTSELRSVVALPNGDVIVGGTFTTIGGVAANRIARWDGSAWHPLGAGISGSFFSSTTSVSDLALLPNGDLAVAGNFTNAGSVVSHGIARWDDSSWHGYAGGLYANAGMVHVEDNGDLLVTGQLAFGAPGISRWNGASWQSVATPVYGSGWLTTVPSGDIILAGEFSVNDPDGDTVNDLARWDGVAWTSLETAATPWFNASLQSVRGVVATSDGTLYATGTFQVVDGAMLNGIARLNGTTWEPVGSPLGIASWPLPYPWTRALIVTANDDIVVGGRILNIAGGPAGHIARWNGTSWDNLGGGVSYAGAVLAVTELPNGDLIVGGDFEAANGAVADHIARWDGTSWHAVGSAAIDSVNRLLTLPNGDVIAGGAFSISGTTHHAARWDGSSWSPLGQGPSQPIATMRLLPDGNVVAILSPPPPTSAWTVQRWDGTSWTQLGDVFVQSVLSDLVVLPDGDLLVTGTAYYQGSTWRWNGSTWSLMPTTNSGFDTHTWMPDGDLIVGGDFDAAGPWLSPSIARLRSNCTASATVTGTGCTGSGGDNVLAANGLPWLGSTFRASGIELPTLAFVAQIWGVSSLPAPLPLSLLWPQAPAGCELHVSTDFVDFAVTTDGTVETALPLPSNPSLVGVQLHHQLNLYEVNASLNVLEVTASNALQLTTGVF